MSMAYRNARVFLADDQVEVLTLVKEVLRESFEVEAFADVDDLLTATAHAEPDLFIVDLVMPKLNGLKLLQELRNRGSKKPFILLSGHIGFNDAIEAIQMGAFDVIEKPFSRERLMFSASKAAAANIQAETTEQLLAAYDILSTEVEQLITSLGAAKVALVTDAHNRVIEAQKRVASLRTGRSMLDVMVGHFDPK